MRGKLAPSLINIFRLFLWVRMAFFIFSTLRYYSYFGERVSIATLLIFSTNLFLLAYLYVPQLQRWLGKTYLPIALILITLLIVSENRYSQWIIYNTDFGQNLPMVGENAEAFINSTMFPLFFTLTNAGSLFVPLVFISWQYNFRSVLIFIVLTTALEIGLVIPMRDLSSPEFSLEVFALITRNGAFIIVGYIVSQLASTQHQQQVALEASNLRLALYATTQEKLLVSQERNRLARELHDTLAHTMSAVTVKLNATHLIMERDQDRAKTMLAEVIASLNDGNVEIRRALRDLRASPLDDMGLVLAIRHLAEAAAQRGNFSLRLDTPQNELRFTPDVELGIYRITQEALTNAVEHAQAKHISLCMQYENKQFVLKIEDDGIGFAEEDAENNGHFGLQGMRERAIMLGGKLKIVSAPQNGTSIELLMET